MKLRHNDSKKKDRDIDSELEKRGFWNKVKENTAHIAATFTFIFTATMGTSCYKMQSIAEDTQDGGQLDTDQDTEQDTGGDADTDVDGDVDTDMDTDIDMDADSDTDTDLDTDTDTDVDSDVDSDVDADSDTDADIDKTFNLIGDYFNRRLLDRENNNDASDIDQSYPIGESDIEENANPFTDGDGGAIGPSEVFMHMIDGTTVPFLDDKIIWDDATDDTYVETQAVWLRGNNHFDADPDEIVGKLDFVAYTVKFYGPGDGTAGITVCTDAGSDMDYTACKDENGDINDATETHRMPVWFLGEQWNIIDINAPVEEIPNDYKLVNGGSVKLVKEAAGGTINENDHIPYNGLKFQLHELDLETGIGIVRVLDADDNVLMDDTVTAGQTKEFVIDGEPYRFHVYKVAPNDEFQAKWIEAAILSKVMELTDGQRLEIDGNENSEYEVVLGWKNYGALQPYNRPDALRLIGIVAEDVEEISSNGDDSLQAGDFIPIAQNPANWKLYYEGLDLTSADMEELSIEIERMDRVIPASKGPIFGGEGRECIVHAPYLRVTVSGLGPFFNIRRSDNNGFGELSDNKFFAALGNGIDCDTNGDSTFDAHFTASTVMMRVSWYSDSYGIGSQVAPSSNLYTQVNYPDIGPDMDQSFANGGVIIIETRQSVEHGANTGEGDNAIGDMLESTGQYNSVCTSVQCPDIYIALSEKSGEGVSEEFDNYWLMGVANASSPTDATFDFDSSSEGIPLTSDDGEVLYGHSVAHGPNSVTVGGDEFYDPFGNSGPVGEGLEMVEQGYISERGSRLESIEDDAVEMSMAQKLARAVWRLISE